MRSLDDESSSSTSGAVGASLSARRSMREIREIDRAPDWFRQVVEGAEPHSSMVLAALAYL